ncbi:KAP family P-loop NTPase fold protein [Streptomyces mayteni]
MRPARPPLTDNPVAGLGDDEYGFRPYVEVLASTVEAARPLPLTVGVFGPWGSGKSSFLRMWQDLLGPEAHSVWINPWKYAQKHEVWSAVITSVLAEIQRNERTRGKALRLARSIAWLTVRGALGQAGALATGGLLDRETTESALDRLAESDAEFHRHVNVFEQDFAEAVGEFVGDDGRLVVFIDDLDRCAPETAVTVLESLKLFTGDSRCVFVLAMDYDLLSAVAARKFGERAPADGAAYLEKIVQLPFFLPEVHDSVLRESLAGHVHPALAADDPFWWLIRVGLGASPRKVKRFVSVLNLTAAVLERTGGAPLDREALLRLAELLILRSEHRGFYARLVDEPDLWQRLKAVAWRRAQPNPSLGGLQDDEALMRLLALGSDVDLVDFSTAPDAQLVLRMIATVRTTAPSP